jgi:hypothetical protein
MCECREFWSSLNEREKTPAEIFDHALSEHGLTCRVMIDLSIRLMCDRLGLDSSTSRLVRRVFDAYDFCLARLNSEYFEGKPSNVRSVSQVVVVFWLLRGLGGAVADFLHEADSLLFLALLHLVSCHDCETEDVSFTDVVRRLIIFQRASLENDVDIYLLQVLCQFNPELINILTSRAIFESLLTRLFTLPHRRRG